MYCINVPAKFGAMSTMLAIAPAYAAVISVTAVNHVIKTSTLSQPKWIISNTRKPGTTWAEKKNRF